MNIINVHLFIHIIICIFYNTFCLKWIMHNFEIIGGLMYCN